LGGSADLTPSNGTLRKDSVSLTPESPGGNYMHFGVREFGMSAIMNGVACHGGFIPYGGTFLTFSDYARNAVRMAALMRLRSFSSTPTTPSAWARTARRTSPSNTWRACGSFRTWTCGGPAMPWRRRPPGAAAIENRDGPTCLIFTRQSLVHEARDAAQVAAIKRGGYVLIDSRGAPEVIVIATGSEVGIAAEAVRTHDRQGPQGAPGVHAEHQHLRAPRTRPTSKACCRRA
jgi:transketolase